MESLWQDVKHSLRTLTRQPGFVAVVALSLALGIGVNTAIFSVLDTLLLKPLPVRDVDQTVYVFHASRERSDSGTSFPAYRHYREHTSVFASIAAVGGARPMLLGDGANRQSVYAEVFAGDFFAIADARFHLGRPFTGDVDSALDPPFSVVLGHRLWRDRLAADPEIVGKSIVLNDRSFSVAGVAAESFVGFSPEISVDVWVPATTWAVVMGERGRLTGEEHWLTTMATLKENVSIDQARAAVAIAGQSLPRTFEGQETRVRSAREARTGSEGDVLAIAAASTAAGLLILTLACLNVTNLLMARAAAREREMSVRAALGARRGRLIRLWVIESALLCLVGGAAGLIVASWLVDLAVAFKPPTAIGQAEMPTLAIAFQVNGRLIAFAFGLSLLTAAVLGVIAGLQSAGKRVPTGRTSTHRFAPGFNLRSAVIASQMALSIVLLITCGLFVRSWINASVMTPGFTTERILVLPISQDQAGVRVQKPAGFEQQLVERVSLLPGVEAATAMDPVPLWFDTSNAHFAPDGGGPSRLSYSRIATGYFATLEIPLLHGRDFTAADNASAPRVAIVNETLAREFWPGASPVGRIIRHGEDSIQVVGVARDVKYSNLAESPPWLYLPLAQEDTNNLSLSLAVRMARDDTATRSSTEQGIAREVRALVPQWPVFQFRTLAEGLEFQRAVPRLGATVLGALGALGLLLAAVGMYGVIAYVLRQRTHEIGIRLALGSSGFGVVALVMKQGLIVCVAGAATGLAIALGVTRFLSSVLVDIGATDPVTYIVVPLILMSVAALACYLPARHAAQTNPIDALRRE